jgi:hypothetical protein
MRKVSRIVIVGLAAFVFAVLSLSKVLAGPGDSIQIGNLKLSPFIEVSGTYDDNVFLTKDNKIEDYYVDVVPGIAFINRTEKLTLKGRGWGQWRWYQDQTDKNSDAYGEKFGLVWGEKERLTLALNEEWVKLTDYEIIPRSVDILNLESQILMLTEDRTERTERELFDVSPILAYDVTDTFGFSVGYDYSYVEYTTNALFDWHENLAQLELQQKVTEKSFAILTLQGSQQASDGFTDTSDYYVLRGGLLYKASTKTTVKASGGYEKYTFGGEPPPGENLDSEIFSFDVAGVWQTTEKLDFELSARNGIQPATQYGDNTKQVTLASLGLSYRMTTTLKLTLAGSARRDDYVGKVDVDGILRDKWRDLWGGRARVDYMPRAKWMDLWLESTYEDVNDNLEDDYNDYKQWRVALGAALRY